MVASGAVQAALELSHEEIGQRGFFQALVPLQVPPALGRSTGEGGGSRGGRGRGGGAEGEG